MLDYLDNERFEASALALHERVEDGEEIRALMRSAVSQFDGYVLNRKIPPECSPM